MDSCFFDGCFFDMLLLGWLLLPFSLYKTPLGETGCLGNPYFLFTGCLSIQFFDSPHFSQYSLSGHPWLPTPRCAAPTLFTGRHATPDVTGTSHPLFTPSATDMRERFLLSGVFYLKLFSAVFKISLGLAVQPQRQQGFILIIETQLRPNYCFKSQ